MTHSHLPHNHGQEIESLLTNLPKSIDFANISELFRQLSDCSRIKIFWILCHCEECVINLSAMMDMSSPAVSHHLKLLKSAGLITSRREGKEVYYYTRIVRAMDCYTDETLEFAMTFHEYSFRDDASTFFPTYMDPATGDATNLAYVDLSCTLRQLTWANFTGVKLTEPVASFKEINTSYNVITLNYVMTNVNEENEVEYYNVEEYYRLRQTPTRIYVLNFERRMDQIFRSENNFLLGTTAILLGIRDNEVEYLANDSGNCIAFVQEGELWCYDRINNTISQVFSFRGAEGINARDNWNEHDIKIVSVDEAGSISFVVSGYMNRGDHEGKVGIGVYYYDGVGHTVEEEGFIPTNKSYEVLQAELGNLMYVNEQKELYFSLNDKIYKVDMNANTVSTIIETKTDDSYAVSKSGRYLAWVKQEELNSSTSIHLDDLKTGLSYEITADNGCYVKPLAFVGEDFVYGVAKAADVKTDSLGDLVYPMSKIEILNTSEDKRDVIKTYSPAYGKVGKVSVDDNNVYLEIVNESAGRWLKSGSDTIMNRQAEPANSVKLRKSVTELKQTQVALNMKEIKKDTAVQIINPKQILLEENRIIHVETQSEGYFYAYARGKVLLATRDAGEAVKCANENYGVVVDSDMKYIFKRARDTVQTAITNMYVNEADLNASSMVKAVSIILNREGVGIGVNDLVSAGQSPVQIMQSTMRNTAVLELRDCTIDELLYYLDHGTPVLARTGGDQAILLTGYSSNYVYYYNPATGQSKSVSYDDIEKLFEGGGNYFIAYVK